MPFTFTPASLYPVLSLSIKKFDVPFILGAPGIGKSAIISKIAKDFDTKLFTVSANNLADKADLTGVMKSTTAEGSVVQTFYPHQTIQEAIDFASQNPDKIALLFLDEVNRAPEDVQTGLMSLSTQRQVGNVKLPDNISIIMAGNDSGNVGSVDSATISRSVLYRLVPSTKELLESAAGQAFEPEIKAWLKKHPDNVFSQPVDENNEDDQNNGSLIADEMGEDFNQFTTPRTIEKLSDFIAAAKEMPATDSQSNSYWEELVDGYNKGYVLGQQSSNILQGIVFAHIGHTPAAEDFLSNLSVSSDSDDEMLPTVPQSVQNVIDSDDIAMMLDQLQPEFVDDKELAERTLVGLFLRGASPAMEDFPVNLKALPGLIDLIFSVQPDVRYKLQDVLSTQGVVSKPALNALEATTNEKAESTYNIINSLIQTSVINVI